MACEIYSGEVLVKVLIWFCAPDLTFLVRCYYCAIQRILMLHDCTIVVLISCWVETPTHQSSFFLHGLPDVTWLPEVLLRPALYGSLCPRPLAPLLPQEEAGSNVVHCHHSLLHIQLWETLKHTRHSITKHIKWQAVLHRTDLLVSDPVNFVCTAYQFFSNCLSFRTWICSVVNCLGSILQSFGCRKTWNISHVPFNFKLHIRQQTKLVVNWKSHKCVSNHSEGNGQCSVE